MLKNMVMHLVKQLVAHPEVVSIEEVDTEHGRSLKINVDKQDVGKVIGKDGQSIKAIRSLVALFKHDQESFADVVIDS
jgi:predicted RNA-binding protein YlqC (UPF0109 family)